MRVEQAARSYSAAFLSGQDESLRHAVDTVQHGLVGGVGEYENAWRMAYVRGPEGIIVSLAQRRRGCTAHAAGRLVLDQLLGSPPA